MGKSAGREPLPAIAGVSSLYFSDSLSIRALTVRRICERKMTPMNEQGIAKVAKDHENLPPGNSRAERNEAAMNQKDGRHRVFRRIGAAVAGLLAIAILAI